jgi:spore coat protein U-like protein
MPVRAPFLVFTLAIPALCLVAKPANAATPSASISVSATIQASCLVSTTDTVFRTYAAAAHAASTVSVTCSNFVPYNVIISAAMAPGATGTDGRMTGSRVALLGYALFSNHRAIANRPQDLSTDSAAGFGSGSNSLLAIHDQIPAAQCATPSAYPDTMIVVVTY